MIDSEFGELAIGGDLVLVSGRGEGGDSVASWVIYESLARLEDDA